MEMSRPGEKSKRREPEQDEKWLCLRVYLRKAGLAVSDVSPVFAVHAVSQFVLPDKGSVLGSGAALQPPRTLGNDATHRLRYTQVHLQHRRNISIMAGLISARQKAINFQAPCLSKQL